MTRWMKVVVHDGEVALLDLGDGGGSMWGSFGDKKTMGSFAKTSLPSSWLQLRRAAVEDSV
jgi:hypothetical protein